jgi:arsenate reductase
MALPTSDDQILLLHNPKCSKSRATLALLEEKGAVFETRRYLENPLDRKELEELGRRLDAPALAFTRTHQAEFEAAGLTKDSPAPAILEAMVAAPILMERPIVIRGQRAAIGRPPEQVLSILDR